MYVYDIESTYELPGTWYVPVIYFCGGFSSMIGVPGGLVGGPRAY